MICRRSYADQPAACASPCTGLLAASYGKQNDDHRSQPRLYSSTTYTRTVLDLQVALTSISHTSNARPPRTQPHCKSQFVPQLKPNEVSSHHHPASSQSRSPAESRQFFYHFFIFDFLVRPFMQSVLCRGFVFLKFFFR